MAQTAQDDPALRERFKRDVLPLLPSLYGAALRLTRNPAEFISFLERARAKRVASN